MHTDSIWDSVGAKAKELKLEQKLEEPSAGSTGVCYGSLRGGVTVYHTDRVSECVFTETCEKLIDPTGSHSLQLISFHYGEGNTEQLEIKRKEIFLCA